MFRPVIWPSSGLYFWYKNTIAATRATATPSHRATHSQHITCTLDQNSPYNCCDVTPQTLNNFNFHYFTIIHSYPILFYIIIKK